MLSPEDENERYYLERDQHRSEVLPAAVWCWIAIIAVIVVGGIKQWLGL